MLTVDHAVVTADVVLAAQPGIAVLGLGPAERGIRGDGGEIGRLESWITRDEWLLKGEEPC